MWQHPGMSEAFYTEAQYLFAQRSFVELARSLSVDDWATPMPCTPGWTVRDALSHVVGVADDALAGRMDGAPGEAWTAAQIERNRSLTVDELLERWDHQAPAFAALLDPMGERRPPFDCHAHEHDVRQALGRPGDRSSKLIEAAATGLATIGDCPVALTVELADGRLVPSGPAGSAAVTIAGLTGFELFRSRLGRRSRDQVRGWAWSGVDVDIDAVVERWFIFGPSADPIIE